jgi:hypothetical protein
MAPLNAEISMARLWLPHGACGILGFRGALEVRIRSCKDPCCEDVEAYKAGWSSNEYEISGLCV